MIRSTIKRAARILIGGAPRIPAEKPSAPPRVSPRQAPDARPPAAEPEVEIEVEIDAATLAAWVESGRDPVVIDIRERYEVATGTAAGAWLIPMNSIPGSLALLPRDRPLVLACAVGGRSFGVAHFLREQGFADAWSLSGGLGAWLSTGAAREVPGPQLEFPRIPVQLSAAAK